MDISARAISLADRPQWAIWVTSVRMRGCGLMRRRGFLGFVGAAVACPFSQLRTSLIPESHADDRGIHHLHRRVTTGGQCIHDPVPDASPPPPDEAIVTSGAGTVVLRQVAPWRT